MTNRKIIVGAFAVSLLVVVGCGDDDDQPAKDAGADASDDASTQPAGGKGGQGGKGGKGGSGGAAGESGSSGESGAGGAGAGGEGGAGGAAGEGGGGTYSIKGQVTGLSGSGLVLQNNGKDDLTIDDAGEFSFATKLDEGADYAVTVKTQPHDPTQGCTVANGTGKVGTADVTNVTVTCTTGKYVIGGTLAGLTGTGLKLKNGTEEITPSGATFAFTTTVDAGGGYAVTITGQPTGQVCGIANATGNASNNVNNVAVTCYALPTLAVEPGLSSAIAWFPNTNATSYTIRGTTMAACDIATKTDCPNAINITDAAFSASGVTIPNLTPDTAYYFVVIGVYPNNVSGASNKTATRPTKPQLNGRVNAVTRLGTTTYTGGTFTRLSVHTGGVVPVNKLTGFPSDIPNFSIIDENILAVASDGATPPGYFVGGTFNNTFDNGTPSDTSDDINFVGLAHVKADGSLDLAWHPAVTGGFVTEIAVNAGKVYVSGTFTGLTAANNRAGLGAVSATDGTLVQTWNPGPVGAVSAIAFSGTNVVLGGSFTNIAAANPTRANAAMVDGTSGALVTAWDPAPDDVVSAIAVNDTTIYLAGEFRNVKSMSRDRIAAVSSTDGVPTSFNPVAEGGNVSQLVYSNNTIYVAGTFTGIGPNPATPRKGAAAIDTTNGSLKAWDPNVDTAMSERVTTLAASGDTVYLAGSFTKIGTGTQKNRAGLAAMDAAGNVLEWDPNPDLPVRALAVAGESVLVAGEQRGIRGLNRKYLAAYDDNGKVTSWSPNADNVVYALAASGSTIYVGGDFSNVGLQARDNLAALAADGSAVADWNPDLNGTVFALLISNNVLYVGGSFTRTNGDSGPARNGIASFPLTSPATVSGTAFAGADDAVRALAINGNSLYVGGDFTQLGGQGRNHIGSVAVDNGAIQAWNPNITGTTVYSLAASGTSVYAGGLFTVVGAASRANLADLDPTTGVAAAFAPNPDGSVYALQLVNGELFVGGDFNTVATSDVPMGTPPTIPTVGRNHYVSFGSLTDVAGPALSDTEGTVGFDQMVRALFVVGGANGVVYAGGDFRAVNQSFSSAYASFAHAQGP